MKAADLNRHNLGQTVSVTAGVVRVTDALAGVSHEADLIAERRINEEVATYLLGRIETTLTFANAGSLQVAGNTEVQVKSCA